MKGLKKFIHFIVKSKLLYVALMGICFGIVVAISQHIIPEFKLFNVIRLEMFISISASGIVTVIAFWLVHLTEYKLEDSLKLIEDYDKLLKRYCAENFVRKDDITVPLSVVTMLKPDTKIEFVETDEKYALPFVCESNYERLLSAHKHSKIFNSDIARLTDATEKDGKLFLTTCHTNYFNSLVTNRACDLKLSKNLTIRGIFEYKSTFTPLRESQLSNELDIIGYVFTSDGYLLFERRDRHKSIAKNRLGNTFGHPVTYNQIDKLTQSNIETHMLKKIEERYHIKPEYVKDKELVALVRTASEAGKPGLLYNVTLSLSQAEFYDNVTQGLAKCKVRNYRYRYILAHPNDIVVAAADLFVIAGKKRRSTIDFVGEYLLCTKIGEPRVDEAWAKEKRCVKKEAKPSKTKKQPQNDMPDSIDSGEKL